MELWLAFGDVPDLLTRGRRDGARYDRMAERGELRTYPGPLLRLLDSMGDVAADLAGVRCRQWRPMVTRILK